MAVKIDADKCIGCGACAAVCADGFELGDDGKAHVKDGGAECVDDAVGACPVQAIVKE